MRISESLMKFWTHTWMIYAAFPTASGWTKKEILVHPSTRPPGDFWFPISGWMQLAQLWKCGEKSKNTDSF